MESARKPSETINTMRLDGGCSVDDDDAVDVDVVGVDASWLVVVVSCARYCFIPWTSGDWK